MLQQKELLKNIVARVPFINFLNIKFDVEDHGLSATLPFEPMLIGNDFLKALHGGAIGSFLEAVAIVELTWHLNIRNPTNVSPSNFNLPKTIDFTIDYISPGKDRDSFAKAKINRSGKRYASVSVEAWQNDRGRPFAQAIGHFLVCK